jgi:hypothetical protein
VPDTVKDGSPRHDERMEIVVKRLKDYLVCDNCQFELARPEMLADDILDDLDNAGHKFND